MSGKLKDDVKQDPDPLKRISRNRNRVGLVPIFPIRDSQKLKDEDKPTYEPSISAYDFFNPETLADADPVSCFLGTKFPINMMKELYDFLGEEKFYEFLDLFAGSTFTVPSREQIEGYIQDQEIYSDWIRLSRTDRISRLKKLCKKKGLTYGSTYHRTIRLNTFYEAPDHTKRRFRELLVNPDAGTTFEEDIRYQNNLEKEMAKKDDDDLFNEDALNELEKQLNELSAEEDKLGQTPPAPNPSPFAQTNPSQPDPPSQFLQALTRWFTSTNTDDDLAAMQAYLKNYRRKQEFFTVGLANVRAAHLATMVDRLFSTVVPRVLDPDRIARMSDKDAINLMSSVHSIVSKESDFQWKFFKDGPQELPPIKDVSHNLSERIKNAQTPTQALQKFSDLSPDSREKVRSLFDTILKYGKEAQSNLPPTP